MLSYIIYSKQSHSHGMPIDMNWPVFCLLFQEKTSVHGTSSNYTTSNSCYLLKNLFLKYLSYHLQNIQLIFFNFLLLFCFILFYFLLLIFLLCLQFRKLSGVNSDFLTNMFRLEKNILLFFF